MAADRSFEEGINLLLDEVGDGNLDGHIEVDQIYAHYQNAGEDFHHPQGGEAHYIDRPLFERNQRHMEHLARNAVTAEGSSIKDAMADNMEDMSEQVFLRAPWEFADLRASGHPFVDDDGVITYDRPPRVHRLTESELRAKGDLRRLRMGNQ